MADVESIFVVSVPVGTTPLEAAKKINDNLSGGSEGKRQLLSQGLLLVREAFDSHGAKELQYSAVPSSSLSQIGLWVALNNDGKESKSRTQEVDVDYWSNDEYWEQRCFLLPAMVCQSRTTLADFTRFCWSCFELSMWAVDQLRKSGPENLMTLLSLSECRFLEDLANPSSPHQFKMDGTTEETHHAALGPQPLVKLNDAQSVTVTLRLAGLLALTDFLQFERLSAVLACYCAWIMEKVLESEGDASLGAMWQVHDQTNIHDPKARQLIELEPTWSQPATKPIENDNSVKN
jgi:hypothetical protein